MISNVEYQLIVISAIFHMFKKLHSYMFTSLTTYYFLPDQFFTAPLLHSLTIPLTNYNPYRNAGYLSKFYLSVVNYYTIWIF